METIKKIKKIDEKTVEVTKACETVYTYDIEKLEEEIQEKQALLNQLKAAK